MSTDSNEITHARFDYKSLDPVVACSAKSEAEHIRDILKHTTAGIIEVGERLKSIKGCLPHGQFSAWIAAEFGMSDRTARLYMSAADLAAGKTETISVLQPTTVYALAAPSTPEAIKTEVLDALDRGEVITDREIKQLIAQQKRRQKEATERVTREKEIVTLSAMEVPVEKVELSLLEPLSTGPELSVASIGLDDDPLGAAIHAVKILSSDDLADFDRWYRKAYPPLASDAGTHIAAPHDNPNQSSLAQESVLVEDCFIPAGEQQCSSSGPEPMSEPVVVAVDDDPIIVEWLGFKPNSQKSGRDWVIHGAPEVVPWVEHHVVADRLKPWREAYRAIPLERQMAIRGWFEQQ